MRIRKAVVTAGGWGTRFLPATKALPKEMLPLVDKPLIQYVVEEAVTSGITQIIIVTALGKRAIEDHFDRSFELEHALQRRGERKLLRRLSKLSDLADICYVRQPEQLGLGHAILITRHLIGDEPFALFLPDDIIEARMPVIRQMMRVYQRYHCSVVAVEALARDALSNYGVIKPRKMGERVYQMLGVVEKPEPEEAPSNLGIVGRYILTPDIFEALEVISPRRKGEIQLTDALALLLQRQMVCAYEFEGQRYDAGTPLGFLKASVEFALRRPDLGNDFREYLQGLNLSE